MKSTCDQDVMRALAWAQTPTAWTCRRRVELDGGCVLIAVPPRAWIVGRNNSEGPAGAPYKPKSQKRRARG